MAVFTYAARDDAGTLVQGDVTATSRDEAARKLRSEGKFIVRVEPKTAAGVRVRSKTATAPRRGKYNPADLIFFTNQMAVMVDTGVSLAEALEASIHEGNSPAFATALDTVIEQINAGTEFSAALAEHPKIFPDLYVSLIKASEASGKMGPILERLAIYLERRHELRKKIKGAITYPIVMCLFALGTTI
ncbi:MAG: type II secretion system F family protein, partial [Phycisphaerae bacterium]